MEYCQGIELLDFLNEADGIQDESYVRYIFKEILKAISSLHKAGMAHCDLKLENIMITKNCEIKLIDMGMISSLTGESNTRFFTMKRGTPTFMCPEMHGNRPYQGVDADIFASFVILFAMRTLELPFDFAISTGLSSDKNYFYL